MKRILYAVAIGFVLTGIAGGMGRERFTYQELFQQAQLVLIGDYVKTDSIQRIVDSKTAADPAKDHYWLQEEKLHFKVAVVLKGNDPTNSIVVENEFVFLDRNWFEKLAEAAERGDKVAKEDIRMFERRYGDMDLGRTVRQPELHSYLLFLSRDSSGSWRFVGYSAGLVTIPKSEKDEYLQAISLTERSNSPSATKPHDQVQEKGMLKHADPQH